MSDPTDTGKPAGRAAPSRHRFGVEDTANHILTGAIQHVGDALHATLSIRVRGEFVVLGATSPQARRAAELQFAIEQGPCLAAFGTAPWIRSTDLANDFRWPQWGAQAAQLGLHSILTIQLLAYGEPAGALALYAETPGQFADLEMIDLALLFATHAGMALASAHVVDGLETAVTSHHTIGMAQGILMERLGLDAEQAWSALRRLSGSSNRKVHDIAVEIVTTRTLPTGRSRSTLTRKPAPTHQRADLTDWARDLEQDA